MMKYKTLVNPGSASRLLLELDCCCFPDIVTEDILAEEVLNNKIL